MKVLDPNDWRRKTRKRIKPADSNENAEINNKTPKTMEM